MELAIAVLETEVEQLKKKQADLCGMCDKCLIRKVVIWLIGMVGVAVVVALMSIIIRAPK